MAHKDLFIGDLVNRFPGHTFTETVINSFTKVEFRDGGSLLIDEDQKQDPVDAYEAIRRRQVGDLAIVKPALTEAQRDALTGVELGTIILNITNTTIERYDGTSFMPVNQVMEGNYSFRGNVKFGGDPTIAPLGAIHVIGTDAASTRIRSMRHQASPNAGGLVQAGHSRGTDTTRVALLSGDRLGEFAFVGDNGNAEAAFGPEIRGQATENWSGLARGSLMEFLTVNDGTDTQVVGLTISQHGYPELPKYSPGGLPDVGPGGGLIAVTGEVGGYTVAFSDGTNWRRVQDRAIVS